MLTALLGRIIIIIFGVLHPSYKTYKAIKKRDYQEVDIDDAIQKAAEHGYTKVVEFGAKGLNYAAKTVLSTALMGQDLLADHLRRRSSSMIELHRPQQRALPANQLGSGDHGDHGVPMFASTPHLVQSPSGHLPPSLEDDPFALQWMHPGSTGSLGRKWRPPLHQGLYLVPEDAENSHESTTADPPTTRSTVPTRRPTNVTQSTVRRVPTRRSAQATTTQSS
ncbi:Receptor expression-enhancing protein [Fasciola hepatica]|uniref:Receptor expression-enhancing protein n=1 Tax=Fasciola hepatica TaxID=6192 RepID=A0A4E0RN64_FASHE|nr:Receptor expression-enhancing protein [Fasciola hepatica]